MEQSKLDLIVYNIKSEEDKNKINDLITSYQPFIIKVISDLKKSYLDIDNDEEFSIGLLAFNEAIERYEIDKGHFLSFAKLVISSRLKNYWAKEEKHDHEALENFEDITENKNTTLELEINLFEKELLHFGLDFDILVEYSPKHKDTRERAIEISYRTSQNNNMMNHLYEKRRLPISMIAKSFNYSVKIIKRSKFFIIASSIIFYKDYSQLKEWLK